jgi:hypothetical protein
MDMEKKKLAIMAFSVLIVVSGGIVTFSVFSGKGTMQTAVPEESQRRALPVPTSADASVTVAAGPQASETKRYENKRYGFSFDIPGDYWYEEGENEYRGEGPGSTATLLYAVEVEDPRLTPEPISTLDGTTHTPKFGTLFTIEVHDKAEGIVPPNGMDYAVATQVQIGGLSGMRYDDRAYSLQGKNFVYSIGLYASETDATEAPEMKKAFEDIVKTMQFE